VATQCISFFFSFFGAFEVKTGVFSVGWAWPLSLDTCGSLQLTMECSLFSSVRTGQHVCHRSFTSFFLSYYSLTVTDSLLTHSVLQPSQRPGTKAEAGENWTTGICTGRFGSAGGVTRSTKAIRWIETCSDLLSSLTHAVVAHRSTASLALRLLFS